MRKIWYLRKIKNKLWQANSVSFIIESRNFDKLWKAIRVNTFLIKNLKEGETIKVDITAGDE